jgi:hypothetical protein
MHARAEVQQIQLGHLAQCHSVAVGCQKLVIISQYPTTENNLAICMRSTPYLPLRLLLLDKLSVRKFVATASAVTPSSVTPLQPGRPSSCS